MIVLLLGAAFGAGLWCWWTGTRPATPALTAALTPRQPPAPVAKPAADNRAGWSARAGRVVVPWLARSGLPGATTAAALRTMRVPVERHLAEKAAAALAGLVFPWLLAVLGSLVGIRVGWVLPSGAAVLLAAVLFFIPDHAVRQDSQRHRVEIRHALSAFLDLTVVGLSGGSGIEQSLRSAAGAGQGPAFAAFRRALREAELTGTAPWGPLARLGEQLGVTELPELAATVALAGNEGARIRASLASKAATLRGHLLSEAEAAASSATERMSIPVVGLFAAFLIFLGYPAVSLAIAGM
ncbi:tight adherence protein C [Streptacidiphilus sp. MAP12-16]|uniref:type II secretion system F family protein n=1 Tax=Streptacidiphilus sp. MAP12-16 TaxID=3156300 RepID=UPI00351630F0